MDERYQRFVELCEKKGVTAYKVAKETGITTATLSNWKNGRYMPKADKNRLCPIHPYILSTLQRNCLKSANLEQSAVFLNTHGQQVKYQRYKEQVYKLNHTPHDTRHTFATCANLCEMDDYAVKLIMGHAVSDLTKRVYTHANEEWLKEQMAKYKIC